MAAQQEVIKAFMKSLDTTTASGVTALNNAVKACSNFESMQAVIDKLISDCRSATSVDSFLRDKCGIILNNADTGAITGSDAGGSSSKTAESIVPESGSASYPLGTSFTRRGLTVIVPNKNYLTTAQRTVVQGLYSWWIDGALKLIEDSYGYKFTDSDATVKTITLKFENNSSSDALAYVTYRSSSANSAKTSNLTLTINMSQFKNLSSSNVNGSDGVDKFYLDRVIAHELTHAIMAAKIDNLQKIPTFILEGTAELVHGVDDVRATDIRNIVANPTQLKNYLNVNNTSTADDMDFAAGYIFLRYLAKQGSGTPSTTPTTSTGTNSRVISSANNIISAGGTYTIKKGFTGTITINTTAAVTLDGASAGTLSNVAVVSDVANADLTIKDLKINSSLEKSLIQFGQGKNNKLTVKGTNTLINNTSLHKAGINVGGGLTIDGTGTLNVSLTGEKTLGDGVDGLTIEKGEGIKSISFEIPNQSAAIGSDFGDKTLPDITIKGGTINASAIGYGSGIGGANNGNIGNITISGGKVTAFSEGAPGIGGGGNGSAGNITINGNAVVVASSRYGTAIGGADGSSDDPSTVKKIIINGNANVTANVTANANKGAGIGSGTNYSSVESITIGGNAKVFATGGQGAGIGNGMISAFLPRNLAKNTVGNITITDKANVTATSEKYGSGIGGGYVAAYSEDTGESYGKSSVGNITISGNAIVNATGASKNVGIGSGYVLGKCTSTVGTIKITGNSSATIISDNTARKITINGKSYSGYQNVFENGSYVGTSASEELPSSTTLILTNSTKSPVTVGSAIKNVNAADRSTAVKITGNALANKILGGSGADNLNGGAGNDSIVGNAGNDSLSGDAGNDTLKGGAGNDTFIYSAGNDVITDYAKGDKIKISSGRISKSTLSGSNVVFTVGSGTLTVNNAKGKTLSMIDSAGKSYSTVVGGSTTNYVISSDNNVIREGGTYTIKKGFTGNITINTADAVTLDGASAGTLSDVAVISGVTNADLTIKDLKITSSLMDTMLVSTREENLIKFGRGKNNKLTVLGTNTLISKKARNKAGINVGGGLTIDGTGTLNVSNELGSFNKGAVIGSDFEENTASDITIKGGTINAVSKGYGVGIGGANKGNIGNITISGGKVTAYSELGTGIGGGEDAAAGNITINGNAVVNATGLTGIGGTYTSRDNQSTVKKIIISGNANVTANGNTGAGIGSGIYNSSVESITIGGNAKVIAKSYQGAGIGNGFIGWSSPAPARPYKNTVGNITITDSANVTATSEEYGAGIGGGYVDAYSEDTGKSYGKSSVGNITISGNAVVNATGKSSNVGIGSGYVEGECTSTVGTIKITGNSSVTINNADITHKTTINGKSYSGAQNIFDNKASAGEDTSEDSTTSTLMTVTNSTKSPVTVGSAIKTVDASKRTTAVKITGNDLANTISGGSKNDSLYGGAGNDSIVGNAGNDKLYGQDGNDILKGGAGNDSLSGGNGNDSLTGGDGNDTFIYSAGKDVITDYATGDKIKISSGTISKSTLSGSNVVFTVGSGTLTVNNAKGKSLSMIDSSGKSFSTILGGSTTSTLMTVTNSTKSPVTIASAIKTVDASKRTTAVKITGNALANTISGGSKNDSLYGGAGNDSILGNAGNDKLYGDAGNDVLKGGAGNDTLSGGNGNDSLWGNAGNDTFIYANGGGKDVIYGFENNDLLQITGNFSASYNKSKNEIAFKVGSTPSAITLKDFTATTFNVNGTSYKISGTSLVKK